MGRAGVSIGSRWTSGSLIARFCIWSSLRQPRGPRFLERLAFSDEFGQGVDACLCAKERCELVVWFSFVDYIAIHLVRPGFEHSVLARLYSCPAWTVGGFLYVVGLVVFAEVSVSSSSLCYYP